MTADPISTLDPPLVRAWGLEPQATLVRQSFNQVFRGRRNGEDVYLRITTADHRAREEIVAEVTWMRRLCDAGVRVSRPLPSCHGQLVEDAGTGRFAVCFARAPGRHAEKPADMRVSVVESWAALLADLHRHSDAQAKRPRWDQDTVLAIALAATEPETALAQRRLRELVAWMHTLDRPADAFGVTHADLHLGNLAVTDDDRVTAFDFDDACHHWFVHDLAVAVTAIRKAAWEAPGAFDPSTLERSFLEAYARAGALGPEWLARIEDFIHYRIALSACWASRSSQLGALDGGMQAWYRRSLPWWLAQLRS